MEELGRLLLGAVNSSELTYNQHLKEQKQRQKPLILLFLKELSQNFLTSVAAFACPPVFLTGLGVAGSGVIGIEGWQMYEEASLTTHRTIK